MNCKKTAIITLMAAVGLYLALPHLNAISNSNPPAYMDDLIMYKAGDDGFILYFVLRDENGNTTAGKGNLHLAIGSGIPKMPDEKEIRQLPDGDLMDLKYKISPSDFTLADIGLGNFKRKEIIYNFGRIKFSDFDRQKYFYKYPTIGWGVTVTFTTDKGKELFSRKILTLEDFTSLPSSL